MEYRILITAFASTKNLLYVAGSMSSIFLILSKHSAPRFAHIDPARSFFGPKSHRVASFFIIQKNIKKPKGTFHRAAS